MACVVQIGAGGVGGVVAHKMAMNREVFSHIVLASRTIEKCHAIAESIRAKGLGEIVVDSVDADSVDSVVELIQKHKPKLVINVALPYQDLAIMEACLQTGVHYLDTANYEHPDSAHFEYKEQWAYDTRFKQAGLFALLGSGFDPGVTNVFCAYAQKHYFDEIESIDILDCNAGDHGYAFATNFNPEINLREVSSKARYWVSSNSSLGNHSRDCVEFGGQSLPLEVTPAPKSTQSPQSNTANTRIVCGEIQDSKANSESTLSDSRPIQNLESNTDSETPSGGVYLHRDKNQIARSADLEGVVGERGKKIMAEGGGSSLANSSPSPLNKKENTESDEVNQTLEAKTLDSKATDSKKSKSLVSPTDLAFNPDLQQDTIYRKFEREEQHWRAEVEQKEREREHREAESRNDWGGNSKIFDEKCGLQEKGRGSYLEGNDQSTFSPLPHLSQKAEFPYCGGEWRDIAPLALMKEWDYPEVGVKNSYLLYHEELESLVRNIRGLKRIRFFMTFGESYLTHMKCLENIGFLRIDEVAHKGGKIVPIEVLKTLLPDPASLAPRTKGQTHIGCYIKGRKDGRERTIYIYNICDHESCYKEVNAQGVSYTTGVPAMIGAKLIVEGKWGIGTIKNSSLGNHSHNPSTPLHCGARSSAPHSQGGAIVQSNTANTRILDSSALDSQFCYSEAIAEESKCQDSKATDSKGISESATLDSTSKTESSVESYNAQRLRLNADMPKGGEYQGIDNAAELVEKAEGLSLDDEQIERLRYEILCIVEDRAYTAYEQDFTIDKHIFTLSFACQYEENETIELHHNKFGFVMGFYPEDFDSDSWFDKFGDEFKEQHPKRTIEWIKSGRFEEKFYELIRPFRAAQGSGVWNMEQNDPDPFMHELNIQGLPYIVVEIESSGRAKVLEDGRKQI